MVKLTSLVVSLVVSSSPLLTGALSVSNVKRQDFDEIFETISSLPDETVAATIPPEALPNQPVQDTVVYAVDGDIVDTEIVRIDTAELPVPVEKRSGSADDFEQVFAPRVPGVPDAAVQGSSYLTYKLVSNATYSVEECIEFCAQTDECIFANLYYEHNNPLLDWVFPEQSNLKCVLFGDVHASPSERTNTGGQQLEPRPNDRTWIEQSSGWALPDGNIPSPPVPVGFSEVFGPLNGATAIRQYMGYALLSKYDPSACAALCRSRAADSRGPCVFFNIWRAVVDRIPKSYTCSMFSRRTTASTATNLGQGHLKVTWSRGYTLNEGV